MRAAWYVINLHEVNWESSLFTRGLGGVMSPDLLRRRVEQLRSLGEIIPVQRGLEMLHAGEEFRAPVFSLWFDDGFAGVRRYALPILQEYGITAAVSICSRFVGRREMFWRATLSFLSFTPLQP